MRVDLMAKPLTQNVVRRLRISCRVKRMVNGWKSMFLRSRNSMVRSLDRKKNGNCSIDWMKSSIGRVR